MRLRRITYFILTIAFMHSFKGVNAQAGLCPYNLDFEAGDFTNWVCRTGNVEVVAGVNTINWTAVGEVPTRHFVLDASTAGTDRYGAFPQLCPNGSGHSVVLGNNSTGRQAEGISYTYSIPASTTVFSMIFNFAVVLEDPEHTIEAQPRFQARLFNVTDNAQVGCINFDFSSSAALPGFKVSRYDPHVRYKDWTPITIDLSSYSGKTIELQFITSDCTAGAHFGYAYIDVNAACNGAISGVSICPGISSVNLSAPNGFESYKWYSDNSFTTILSSSQHLLLDPAPIAGTIFPVIVSPFPGFGCVDTLYGKVKVATSPVSNAGPDISFCYTPQAQIGAGKVASYLYEWSPASQVSNPIISNPLAWGVPSDPTLFIVKTTDVLTGCYSYDTTAEVDIPVPGSRYKDVTVTLGGAAFLLAKGNPSATFRWEPALQLSSYNTRRTEFFSVDENDKKYIIYVKESKCTVADTILINVLKKPGYYLPTGFTPNGDGLNDIVRPFLVGMESLKSFSVFNRWGNRVFYSTTQGEGWNGKFKGLDMDPDVYVWKLEFYDKNNKLVTASGNITIIR